MRASRLACCQLPVASCWMQTLSYAMDAATNPYIALREAKIARNQARLKELGLVRPRPTMVAKAPRRNAKATPPQPVRRSSRHKGGPLVSYKEMEVNEPVKRPRHVSPDVGEPPEQSTPSTVVSYPPNAAKSMAVDVSRLLERYLGVEMERTGKAAVMEESARCSGYEVGAVSFNKYSGVQEWGNGVFFLWINLGAPGSDVVNDFHNDGKQVTWFGGSRMHSGTKVIRSLVRRREQLASGAVVLWCRAYDPDSRSLTPYTCFGRLGYASHDENSLPIAFRWNLLDYEALVTHPNLEARERIVQTMTFYAAK